jgi:predicted metal-dependent hydrolase
MMQNQLLILNDGQQIPYLLEHRPRRTVGLKITEQGLIVHAPKRIFAAQLNKILQEKSGWIINKLQLRDENKVEKVEWIDGAQLLFLGQDITLKLVANIGANKTKKIHFERNELVVHALGANIHAACRASVLMWYKNQAQLDFARRLEVFAAKLGIATPPLTLSNAKSRWGSCNSRKEIRLNWRLLQAPPGIINYVICHELAHIKQMNHSAKFWAVVASLFPDYKDAEKQLKILSPQLHRL